MSSSVVVDLSGLNEATRKVAALAHVDVAELMAVVGELGESQTRRRITDEKTSPDGTAWPPNLTGTSILLETGDHLLSSVAFMSSADEAKWGASWEYAHVHQDGLVIKAKDAPRLAFMLGDRKVFAKQVTIPPRPFVGLSADNLTEIGDVVTDWLGAQIP